MRTAATCLLLCLGAALVGADRPHEATISLEGREPQAVYIIHDNRDKLHYSQDEQGQQRASFPQDKVSSIEYGIEQDRNIHSGRGKLNQGKPGEAVPLFEKAITGADTEYDQVQAYLGLIQAHGAAKDAAAALATAQAFAAALPESRFLAQGLDMAAEIQLAAKEFAGAETVFALLDDLGPEGAAKAAAGAARVLLAKGDAAAAAAAVDRALSQLKRDQKPDAYAALGIVGVRAKLTAEDQTGAATLADQIKFLGTDPAPQAEAHLVLAESLAESDAVAAFDHAAIAALRAREVAPKIQAEAAALGRKLGKQLSADESLSDEDRLAYKEYASKL